ncbi:MAG: hypothetical protein V7765_04020 [Oleispira sp.]
MKWIFTFAIIISPVFMTGCNLDLSQPDKSNKPTETVEVSRGSLEIGSTTRYEIIFTTNYQGQIRDRISIDSTAYTSVNQLPTDYGYQDSEGGPYLEITTTNSFSTGFFTNYINSKGSLVLSVDQNTYSTEADREYFSERDSSSQSYTIGESYKVTDNQKRYRTYTHNESSSTQSISIYTPKAVETISTASGTYNTLRIEYTSETNIINSNNTREVRKARGSNWLDIASGKLVKDSASGVSERSDVDDVIRFDYSRILVGSYTPIKAIESTDVSVFSTPLAIRNKSFSSM